MINELTKQTFKETDNNLNLVESDTAEEMFEKLGIGTKSSDKNKLKLSKTEDKSHPSPRRRRTEDEVKKGDIECKLFIEAGEKSIFSL